MESHAQACFDTQLNVNYCLLSNWKQPGNKIKSPLNIIYTLLSSHVLLLL